MMLYVILSILTKDIITPSPSTPKKKKSGMLTNSEPVTPNKWIVMFTALEDELSISIYQSESESQQPSPSYKTRKRDELSISTTKISFGTVNIIGINLGKIINILAIPNCINKCCTDPVECSSPNETTQIGGFIPLSPPTQSLTGTSIKLDVNLTNERFKYSTTDAKKDAWQDCCDTHIPIRITTTITFFFYNKKTR